MDVVSVGDSDNNSSSGDGGGESAATIDVVHVVGVFVATATDGADGRLHGNIFVVVGDGAAAPAAVVAEGVIDSAR